MKNLGLPLGFLNCQAMLVDDDGKVRVTPTIPSITANRSFDHENKFCDTKKKRHGKRGKKVIFSFAFSLLSFSMKQRTLILRFHTHY